MSAQPKPSVGDELRALARQRRDAAGGPFELHPATRRLLQDEVAKRFPHSTAAPAAPKSLNWFQGLWLRLAFAGGLLVLFAVFAVLWMPRELPAKRETSPAVVRKGTRTAQPPAIVQSVDIGSEATPGPPTGTDAIQQHGSVVPAGTPLNDSLAKADTAGGRTAEILPGTPVQAVSASQPSSGVKNDGSATVALRSETDAAVGGFKLNRSSIPAETESLARVEQRLGKAAQTSPEIMVERQRAALPELEQPREVALTLAPAKPSEPSGVMTTATAPTNVIVFAQADVRARHRRNFNSPPLPPVLRSFQVERSGSHIRILDEDGSIYEGGVDPETQEPMRALSEATVAQRMVGAPLRGRRQAYGGKLEQPPAGAIAPSVLEPTHGLIFRAVGTNQSTHQRVVIRGELSSESGTASASGPGALGGGGSSGQTVTLRGKVMIGARLEMPLDASGTAVRK